MDQSQDISELAAALSKAQGKLKNVLKQGKGNYGKYAELGDTLEEIRPILSAHELSVVQLPVQLETGAGLSTQLMHKSGQWIRGTFGLLTQQQTPQGQGSAITYARRYALAAVLGIAGDDDDGQAGSAPVEKTQPKPAAAKPTHNEEHSSSYVSEAQVKLLLARTRDHFNITDRQEVYDKFLDEFGIMPNEVRKSEIDDILKILSGGES